MEFLMLKKYTFWMRKDGSEGTISQGEEIPKFGNGTPMFCKKDVDIIYVMQAETWEEAMSIHNLRQGYNPYIPGGQAEICPECSNYYYPSGSGKCFCGYDNDKVIREKCQT